MSKSKGTNSLWYSFLMATARIFIMAWPMQAAWNHVAPTYFYWLPTVYHNIGYWNFFCITFSVRTFFGLILLRFDP